MAHLITGYAGVEHIMSADQGSYNAAFFGDGQFVMESGNQFEASITDNNTVRILDGDLLMYGRHVRIDRETYEDLTIETGTAGMNRIDLICMTYSKNTSTGVESAYLEVIKGTETSGEAVAPSYTNGNILTGAVKNQMPLYKVSIVGVVLDDLITMFDTQSTYKDLAEQYEEEFKESCNNYLDSLNVLDSEAEILANTQSNNIAGALGVKEIYNELNESLVDVEESLANLPKIQYGTVTLDITGNYMGETDITFESGFTSPPNVYFAVYHTIISSNNAYSVFVRSNTLTANGCRIRVTNTQSSEMSGIKVMWLAIGK